MKDGKWELAEFLDVYKRQELIWLYYNCLSEYGNEYFKPLIERYALLKNIRKDLLIEDDSIGSYSKSAYMKTCPSDADR